MFSVYKIENIQNSKVYVGQTTSPIKTRWNQHASQLRNKKHHNEHLQNAWFIYGEQNFKITQIFETNCINELNQKEIEFIKQLKSDDGDFGYNKTPGGLNYERSDETRDKLSKLKSKPTEYKSSFGDIPLKDNKRSLSKRGSNNPMKGKTASNARKVRCIETGVIFNSLHAAAKHHQVLVQNLWHVLKGKYKRTGGYSFEYAN